MKQFSKPLVFLILLCLGMVGCKTHKAEYYEEKARTEMQKEDYDAAIRDLNQALELKPKDPDDVIDIYYMRAVAHRNTFKLDPALADFNSALALMPNNPIIIADRAFTKFQKGDIDAALADSNMAVSIEVRASDTPANQAYILNNRGFMRLAQKDFAGAESDLSLSIKIDSEHDMAYLDRGILRTITGNWDGALDDYNDAVRSPTPSSNSDYSYLMIWLIKAQKGQADAATVALAHELVENWSDDVWSKNVAAFLVGQTSEADFFIQSTKGPDYKKLGQTCESNYYAGMKRLLAGNKAGAEEAFRNCIATKRWDYTEYHLAAAEIDQIEHPAPAPAVNPTGAVVSPAKLKAGAKTSAMP